MIRWLTALVALIWATAAHADVTAVVSNAPIWATGTAYDAPAVPARFGSRVNSGPGTIGGTYTSSSAVYVWQALTSGTSASSGNGPQTCGTPGTTIFTESTGLQWKCLAIVDYVTWSSWAFDAPARVNSTLYHWHDYVKANGNIYRADQSSGVDCTAGTSAPSGTSNGQTDGTCTWDFAVAVPYWSGSNGPIPHQRYLTGQADAPTIGITVNYTAQFFHGGTATPEYLADSGGEAPILVLQAHQDFTSDEGISNETTPIGWVDGGPNIIMTCAPVDCSIGTGSLQPLAYDNTQFVSWRNTANVAGNARAIGVPAGNNANRPNTGFTQEDANVRLNGIAIKADHGMGVDGNRPNAMIATNFLVDANNQVGFYTDASSMFSNGVIINRSSAAGSAGLFWSYGAVIDNLTIYMPNAGTNAICIAGNVLPGVGKFPLTDPHIANTMMFGCPNTVAFWTNYVANFVADGNQVSNATDQPNSTSSPSFTFPFTGDTFVGIAPPGVSATACGGSPCYSLSFSSVFTSTSDLREKSTAPTRNAGNAFSLAPGSPWPTITNALDFYGHARAPYDIGAAIVTPGALSATLYFPATSTTLTFTDDLAAAAGVPTAGGDVKDIGDYVGAFVCQHRHRQISSDNLWYLDFGTDCTGGRVDFIVAYGVSIPGASVALTNQQDPYVATFYQGTTQLGQVTVPLHWSGSMWRWTNQPAAGTWAARPIVRTPDDLRTAHLMIPYDTTQAYIGAPGAPGSGYILPYNGPFNDGQPGTYAGPMDGGILARDMGTTGEREEIGYIPEPCANSQIFDTTTAYTVASLSCIAMAEATGSIPTHFRDQGTHALANTGSIPNANDIPLVGGTPSIWGTQRNGGTPAAYPLQLAPPPQHAPLLAQIDGTASSGSILSQSGGWPTAFKEALHAADGGNGTTCYGGSGFRVTDITNPSAIPALDNLVIICGTDTAITLSGNTTAASGDWIQLSNEPGAPDTFFYPPMNTAAAPATPVVTPVTGGLAITSTRPDGTWQQVSLTYVDGSGNETTSSVSTTVHMGGQAQGNIVFSGQPANLDTITLAGTTVTFVTGTPSGNQVQIDSDMEHTIYALYLFLRSSGDANLVKFSYITDVDNGHCCYPLHTLYLLAAASGTAGNSLTVAVSGATMTASGATLANGASPPKNLMSVASPAPATGMVGYNVYKLDAGGVPQYPGYTSIIATRMNTTPIAIGTGWTDNPFTTTQPWTLDPAHAPSAPYVAFVMTDDPYYLEMSGDLVNMCITISNGEQVAYQTAFGGAYLKGLFQTISGQIRAVAWNLTKMFQARQGAALATTAPSWIMSTGTIDSYLSDTYNYFDKHITSPALGFNGQFKQLVIGDVFATWQSGFLLIGLGGGKWMGASAGWNSNWDTAYQWTLDGYTPFLDGSTSWCQALFWGYPGFGLGPDWITWQGQMSIYHNWDGHLDAAHMWTPSTYAKAYAQAIVDGPQQNGNALVNDYWGNPLNLSNCSGGGAYIWGSPYASSADYAVNTYGAIALASQNGMTSAAAAKAYLDAAMPPLMGRSATCPSGMASSCPGGYGESGSGVAAKWSIAAGAIIPPSCTISSVSLSNTSFLGGSTSGTAVGTMSASTTGVCGSSTWSITSTGSDHSSTACNAASGTDFQAAGSSLELNTTLGAGTYSDICYTDTISGATGSPFTQAVTITGTSSPSGGVGGGRRLFR